MTEVHFSGEYYKATEKETSYCKRGGAALYNSTDKFGGVEYYLQKAPGVISTTVGYMGGTKKDPTYQEVNYHKTGQPETVQVIFANQRTSFENMAKWFFEIYDPTQTDGQGPDIGDQYRSEIFYTNEKQHKTAQTLINIVTFEQNVFEYYH